MLDIDDAVSQLRTVRDFIRWAVSHFNAAELTFGHGTDNALDEAVALIAAGLHLPPDLPQTYLDARLTERERRSLTSLVQRRVEERKPVPYLTHEAWFGGLSFYVDERVLIPRSPIAELIESGFEPWADRVRINRILDLCTGSACIAIACACAFPDAEVDAVDLSTDALEVGRVNVERYHLQAQVHLIRSNLFAGLSGKTYDIIVSNPPYVSELEMQELPLEYRYEPAIGLVSGSSGLDATVQILREAASYLSTNGILVVEVGNSALALSEHFPEIPFLWLEFERGGEGVFLLTRDQLLEHQAAFASVKES